MCSNSVSFLQNRLGAITACWWPPQTAKQSTRYALTGLGLRLPPLEVAENDVYVHRRGPNPQLESF
jgi:hypothetical protein